MSDGVAEQIIAFVGRQAPHLSSLSVEWYGGEPLLCLDRIQSLTAGLKGVLTKDCKYSAAMVTNGYFLTADVAETLKNCDVRQVQVTIDGSKKDHDSRRIPANGSPTYELILQNVEDCADIINISIRVNVDKSNIGAADELLDQLEKRGLKNKVGFYLAPVDDINETCTNDIHCMTMREFSEEEVAFCRSAVARGFSVVPARGFSPSICGAVTANSYVIDPLGDLYKCWDEIGDIDRKVGSVMEGGSIVRRNLVRWLNYEPTSKECLACNVFPMCMGGCPHHVLDGGSHQCISARYDIDERMLLAKASHGVEKSLSHA